MKTTLFISIFIISLVFAAVSLLFFPNLVFSSSIVFDNTSTQTDYYSGSGREFGDQITLAGTDRLVTEFLFGYRIFSELSTVEAYGDETAQVRFRANEGLGGIPGTVLYDSGVFHIDYQKSQYSLTNISVQVPDTFTWTILFGEIDWTLAGLPQYDPPTIGSSEHFAWFDDIILDWVPISVTDLHGNIVPMNFEARITAEPVPEPATMLLVGSGLLGLWGARKKFKK